MGNIKDIIDLAKDLESRAKDRKDIDTLREIISLTQSIQASDTAIQEKYLGVLNENHQVKIALEDQKRIHTQEIATLNENHRAELAKIAAENMPSKAHELEDGCKEILIALANFSGSLTRSDVLQQLGIPKVQGDYWFDQLKNLHFVVFGPIGSASGLPVHVSPAGRDYLAKSGLLAASPRRPLTPQASSTPFGGRRFY
jgi:hypothetical protein